jgi:hypothetical protein
MVVQLRAIKQQLAARNELLKDQANAEGLVQAGKALIDKLDALEAKLHNPKAQVAYDILAQRGGAQLYSKLGILYDWLKDSDGPPTQGMREVYSECARELQQHDTALKALLSGELTKLNATAKTLDLPGVFVPPADKVPKKD